MSVKPSRRTPFKFHSAYCEGKKNEMGYWEADGRSERADTELVERLSIVMIKRAREEIWAHTPAKTRQVVWVDVGANEEEGSEAEATLRKLRSETHYFKALENVLKMDEFLDAVTGNVVEEAVAGDSSVVWVLTRESVEVMTKALEKALDHRDVRTRIKQVKCRLWATHGEADIKTRTTLAREYREHIARGGVGIIVATMDSMPESISLFGASFEHYAQVHYVSGPMEQTENRPLLEGTSKLHIMYYFARRTISERMGRRLLPRLMAADKIAGSKDASAIAAAIAPKEESWEEFMARLTANVPEDGLVDLGGGEDSDGGD